MKRRNPSIHEQEEECPSDLSNVFLGLPSYNEAVKKFGVFLRSEGRGCNPEVDFATCVIKCACDACATWRAYLEGRPPFASYPRYEVWTKEYVAHLALYLIDRALFYGLPKMLVLEIGAGDGRLSQHLREAISNRKPILEVEVSVVATDNNSRGLLPLDFGQDEGGEISSSISTFPKKVHHDTIVEIVDAEEAIAQKLPHVVISSWMPMGVDWTAAIRGTPSVLEYILIGEKEGGICGHPDLTWNFDDISDDGSLPSSPGKAENGVENAKNEWEVGGSPQTSLVNLMENSIPEKNQFGLLEKVVSGNCDPRCSIHGGESNNVVCRKTHSTVFGDESVKYDKQNESFWARKDMDDISKWQLCRTDELWALKSRSATVCFRRLLLNKPA